MHVNVNLSKLVPSRINPRRVRPEREAHRRLVASIRAFGLIEPLVVRPADAKGNHTVIAGNRRLAALRVVHKGEDPKIPCEVRDADTDTAHALSLSENFTREAMHPLDEAEAFARLASVDCKGVEAIAAEFGVGNSYVRQRMKLAALAGVVKSAYRAGEIDTATAEAFAAVPAARQLAVWAEVGGQPRDARRVRSIIEEEWIEASHALFDVGTLPEAVVSQDLFGGRVLVERGAFMAAQREALLAERHRLEEDGWKEVTLGTHDAVQDRLLSMTEAVPEYDGATLTKLDDIAERRRTLEEETEGLTDDEDEEALRAAYERFDALEREEEGVTAHAEATYSEGDKAVGTVFLMLDPDGRVRRAFRVPRVARDHRANLNGTGRGHDHRTGSSSPQPSLPPTSDDLTDRQQAATSTAEAAAVRRALLSDTPARKRVLTLLLHEKVSKDALTVRHQPSRPRMVGGRPERDGFSSPLLDTLRKERAKVDPFSGEDRPDEAEAYCTLCGLPEERIDRLIECLTVEYLAADLHRPAGLITVLAGELGVNVRDGWLPDAAWLSGYTKAQLAHLMGELKGVPHGTAALRRGKSELLADLADLFADAADEKLEDRDLADRVNGWFPASPRHDDGQPPRQQEAGAVAVAA